MAEAKDEPKYLPIYDEEKQMDLRDFFRAYKNKLPQLVIITEGHYGETNFDDFANDQVLYIVKYTRQRRVLAQERKVHSPGRVSYLSLPVDTPYMLKVIQGHKKVENEAKLSDIIKSHDYPIMVKFARDYQDMRVGGCVEDPKSFASLLLIKEYEENYLCCHCLENGVLRKNINLSALSVNISCTLITGIVGKTKNEFRNHLLQLNKDTADVKYVGNAGNPEITRITDEGTGTGNPLPELDPPFIPQEDHGPAPPVPPRNQSSENVDSDDDNYEPPPIPVDHHERPQPYPMPKKKQPIVHSKPAPKTDMFKTKKPYENAVNLVLPMIKSQEPPKQQVSDTKPQLTEEYVDPEGATPGVDDIYEELPDEPFPDDIVNFHDDSSKFPNDSANLLGDSTKFPDDSAKKKDESPAEIVQRPWLDDLTVNAVGDVLKQLKLSQYADKFAKDLVSGSILEEFNEDILKEEYHFKRIEIIRLMKYVRTGHIPH